MNCRIYKIVSVPGLGIVTKPEWELHEKHSWFIFEWWYRIVRSDDHQAVRVLKNHLLFPEKIYTQQNPG